MLDRRASCRRRTLLEGRIEIDALNGWALDCGVRNIGEGGACLALSADVVVPSPFKLGISGEMVQAARLVWYKNGRAGVAFAA